MVTLIGIIALAVLGIVCGILALWCKYDDGVMGHLSLATVALAALVVVLESLDGIDFEFLPTSTAVFVGAAIFMTRHLIRFVKFNRAKNDGITN